MAIAPSACTESGPPLKMMPVGAFAAISAILGYVFAGYGPGWFGAENAVSAAGVCMPE